MLAVAAWSVVICTKDGRVTRRSGVISSPTVGLIVVLISAIRFAVCGRLVERAPMVLAVYVFPRLFAVRLLAARRLLILLRLSALPPPIGTMPLLLCLQDGAV